MVILAPGHPPVHELPFHCIRSEFELQRFALAEKEVPGATEVKQLSIIT
jgi:hypothetical protein